jgi:hypothetical protein
MDGKIEDAQQDDGTKKQWLSRVAQTVDSYRALERETWGGIDEDTLIRYMGNQCTAAERSRVEEAMREFPAIREAVELHREVVAEGMVPPPDGDDAGKNKREARLRARHGRQDDREPPKLAR